MAGPRFKGLGKHSPSLVGGIAKSHGKARGIGLLMPFPADANDSASAHPLQAWVAALHAVL